MDDELPKVDDAVLDKIASLTGIDEASKREASAAKIEASKIEEFCRNKREAFHRLMRGELKEACLLHLKRPKLLSTFPKLSEIVDDLNQIGEMANAFAKVLEPSDAAPLTVRSRALKHFGAAMMSERYDTRLEAASERHDGDYGDLLERLRGLLALAALAALRAQSDVKDLKTNKKRGVKDLKGYKKTNKPPEHLGAEWVVRSLLVISNKMGDKLTFSRMPSEDVEGTRVVQGPLIEAINILKDADKFFSSDFFPPNLQRLCERVRRKLQIE